MEFNLEQMLLMIFNKLLRGGQVFGVEDWRKFVLLRIWGDIFNIDGILGKWW
jgi:hypothetical protein